MSVSKCLCIFLMVTFASACFLLEGSSAPKQCKEGDDRFDVKKEKKEQAPMKIGSDKKNSEEIILVLSKSRVTPGEKVRLTELVPNSQEGIVASRGHYIYLIGEFNRANQIFNNLKPKDYYWRKAEDDFDRLPSTLSAFNGAGFEFNVTNPRQKGFEYEFTTRHIGVFQITAYWLVSNSAYYYSVPIILTVEPPINEKGERIIKPEWIIND
jgi:hypothetical protein